jgi:hypothetical protein
MSSNILNFTMKTALFTRTRTLSAALLLLCVAACNQGSNLADKTRRRAVDPALKNSVPFRDFTINTDKNDTIALAEGTKLFIPAGIFVDAKGNPVKGDVQLHYRAFYTPGDIIASGISMVYDSANVEHVFSSAGMFEINGTQNGEPVSIAKGKAIDMDFASTRDDATYSFYQMDTAKAKWNFISTGKAEPNAMREELTKQLAQEAPKPVEPKLYDATKPVINIDVDVANHPELSGYEGLLWQYAGSGTDPEKNKWIYETDWNSAQLTMKDENTCMYGLNLSGPSKSFATNVYPTLKGQDYQQAMVEFREKMETFKASETIRQQKRKDIALTAQFQRKTRVANFGLCNYDQFFIYGDPEQVFAEFHFTDPDFENHRENVAVYFVAVDGRFIAAFNGGSAPKLTYVPDKNSCMIAVLRGTTKAEVLNNGEFLSAVSADKSDASVFRLHPTSQTVSDSKDIDLLISKL